MKEMHSSARWAYRQTPRKVSTMGSTIGLAARLVAGGQRFLPHFSRPGTVARYDFGCPIGG